MLELKEKTEALQTQNDYLGTCLVKWDDELMGFQVFLVSLKIQLPTKQAVPQEQWSRAFFFMFLMDKDGFFFNQKSYFFEVSNHFLTFTTKLG